MNLPDGHEWCTTNSHTKRHISGNLRTNPHTPRLMGRHGRTLCGCGADDERRANYWNNLYGNGKTVKVADLEPCQSCTRRAAAKLKATAGAR